MHTKSPTEGRERNLDEGLEDMHALARDEMKGKKLGAQKKGEVERVPGKQSGNQKGVQGFKRVWTSSTQRSVSQRVLTQIGSADYACRYITLLFTRTKRHDSLWADGTQEWPDSPPRGP